jgi:hypothetical protein
LGNPVRASRKEVFGMQVGKHKMPENSYWAAEPAVVAKKRVMIVEQRAGR